MKSSPGWPSGWRWSEDGRTLTMDPREGVTFHRGAPFDAAIHLDKVTFLPIPDTTVRPANLRSGDIDMLERLAATDAGAVKGRRIA